MAGNEKGKHATFSEAAYEMYVKERLGVTAISTRLRARHGAAGPSATIVRQWADREDWDADRKAHIEKSRAVITTEEKIYLIAGKMVDEIEKKNTGDLTTGDIDTLAKANKILQSQRDPRQVLKISIDVMTNFIEYVNEKHPDLAPMMVDAMDGFLTKLREDGNG